MSEENVEIVRRGYDAFARGDIAGVLEIMGEDVEWQPALAPLLGVEPVRGKLALERFFTVDLAEGFVDFQAVAVSTEDLGELVLVQTHYAAKGRSSGAPVAFDAYSLIKVHEGKTVSFRDYETRAEALEAAGLSE